jgi:CTP:molybdopterin cytidylyltransferase MocA
MVAGVILAAGRSSRMGRSKALLRQIQSGHSFVSHLIRVAGGVGLSPILVVGRPEDAELRSAIDRTPAVFIPNPDADRGQLSSLLAGLAAAEGAGADGVMVMPVDVPLISTGAVASLLRAAESSKGQIVRAAYQGRHGHPVLFKRSVFEELRAADPATGARAVVRATPSRVVDVEVADAGVTLDIDTPEDYLRAFGRKL